ncbi:hypothetical protein DPMN_162717 [Dreissena polymorpha]|uniref:Uncharacterized protein n=1 Tax=Dreissena polymorpha TaxID=45954 RepID=A0A9D4ER24_DREPO|nr:hypothetical protein DPMN_162717 [Dreissena polymorpha]
MVGYGCFGSSQIHPDQDPGRSVDWLVSKRQRFYQDHNVGDDTSSKPATRTHTDKPGSITQSIWNTQNLTAETHTIRLVFGESITLQSDLEIVASKDFIST